MSKGSNPMPPGEMKHAPPDVALQRMAIIFNEWAMRYAESPDEFSDILDSTGNPVSDYGECCAIYFNKLSADLDQAGKLPKTALSGDN